MRSGLALTRSEAKSITRRRLLDAAGRLLAESGYGGLSASAVARAAGIAQPTFYVHFRDKDDLLRTLGEEQIGTLRVRLREARARIKEGEGEAAVRDAFRIPLDMWIAHPGLMRLNAQELHQPNSPLARILRGFRDEILRDLADDLAGLGLPSGTPAERERLEMVAEAMMAQTEALALGYLDGRYTSVDAIVDVLTAFALGFLRVDELPAVQENRPATG
jgi:TetR/AcrR family transcriptional regulator, fatty acid biosynthesis regulator